MQTAAVSEPLNQLVAGIERLRGGDFTQRLALNRADEFGVLGDGLNRLADDLSTIVGQVQRSGSKSTPTRPDRRDRPRPAVTANKSPPPPPASARPRRKSPPPRARSSRP